ncbi:hydantoinase B/oxoprolinase family protein [Zhongshania sp.]|uniref:hydantoinase B/oxoprolinase family protein n=1 Tax=Zhongshania sp. TaxID=1971902 RepID=UPI001B7AD30B|nr:hydantoinase B/oxoprolinase family protein [Zhongshania sp.]MBQ0795569.1 hydantoinase B/oxoprolinase family protein [Zhongshania sp.]
MTAQLFKLDPVKLGLFVSRLESVCEEMGAVLQRAAFSPNIKDRLDFSCAIFDARGELCAQAAHIPVHLGSMAYAMADIVSACEWHAGDMVVVNDPFLGGTHLPDVTVIAPFFDERGELLAFIVNRAHHADIGASTPGSMPLSQHLDEEGVVIPPTRLVRNGELDRDLLNSWFGEGQHGDFIAQISANRSGLVRLAEVIAALPLPFPNAAAQLQDYAEGIARRRLAELPAGTYHFTDYMDGDWFGHSRLAIAVSIRLGGDDVVVDFSGSAAQVAGNINCPLSVAAAAVYYVFRCLMPNEVPVCMGLFRPIQLSAPVGSLLNAQRPAAVAAGNVETSMRITDAVLGALAQAVPELIPAASQGSMNNVAMGGLRNARGEAATWNYYETIAGGMGAHADGQGLSAVQSHMTNTLNTPVESLEMHYPLRIKRYALRKQSGGSGQFAGGEGVIREFEFLAPAQFTLLTERRSIAPWGLAGGGDAQPGRNLFNGQALPAKVSMHANIGDVLTIETPGGGGWGGLKASEV